MRYNPIGAIGKKTDNQSLEFEIGSLGIHRVSVPGIAEIVVTVE
jgi:hypothetical protein